MILRQFPQKIALIFNNIGTFSNKKTSVLLSYPCIMTGCQFLAMLFFCYFPQCTPFYPIITNCTGIWGTTMKILICKVLNNSFIKIILYSNQKAFQPHCLCQRMSTLNCIMFGIRRNYAILE